MRIGIGYDVHRLVEGRPLILGGVTIPFDLGLDGHSDADVLTHSICDAILGAAALGDIGTHFPDTDPQFKDIRSLELLAHVCKTVRHLGFDIHNVDAIVFAEAPRVGPYRSEMEQLIAESARIDPGRINVKATTTEGLGWVGRGEGIGAMSTVLLST